MGFISINVLLDRHFPFVRSMDCQPVQIWPGTYHSLPTDVGKRGTDCHGPLGPMMIFVLVASDETRTVLRGKCICFVCSGLVVRCLIGIRRR